MILLCIVPIFLFILINLFFPNFAYLSLLVLLICPISMAIMMYFMNKEEKTNKDSKTKKMGLHMKSQISIKRNKKLQHIWIILIVIVVGALFFYIAILFGGSESGVRVEKPLIYCQPQEALPEQQKCFYTAHDHFQLILVIDEKKQEIGFEKGDLQRSHSHAEKDKIHWHSLLAVNSTTRRVVDWTPHSLKAALQDLGYNNFGNNVIVIVNKQVENQRLDYIWQDRDIIEVRIL